MFYSFNYWLFMLPAIILTMLASWYVQSAYRRWGRVPASSRISGAEAAQRLALYGGLSDVRIQVIGGTLTDHYDPRDRVLRLSAGVAQSTSVAALAVAAHELGHAQQHAEGYFPLQLRSALVPAVNIGSNLGWILILIGLMIRASGIAWLGVMAFSLGAVFALATLPVELNASARARALLRESGLIRTEEEMRGVSTVLNAAALTYVAAVATSLLQLLYYVSLVAGLSGRRR